MGLVASEAPEIVLRMLGNCMVLIPLEGLEQDNLLQ